MSTQGTHRKNRERILAPVAAACAFLAVLLAQGCAKSGDPPIGVQSQAGESQAARGALTLTDSDFAETTKQGVALVDFWSERCPPCRKQGPVVDRIAEKFRGRAVVGKVDVDANRGAPRAFGVQYIPTLVVLRDGREVKRFVGFQEESVLAGALEDALAGD